jgi:hypothetical protein
MDVSEGHNASIFRLAVLYEQQTSGKAGGKTEL